MIFKNYEYFLAIAQTKSISRAAQQLYISQPSLSKYLKRLEEKLGAELFLRGSHPLELTVAGQLYLSYVQDILQRERRMLRELKSLKSSETGVVTIGMTPWRSSILLPAVLPKFRKKYPGIEVKILEGSHQYMFSLIESGKVDFAIFHQPNWNPNLTFERLTTERILLCISSNSPLLDGSEHQGLSQLHIPHMSDEEFMRFQSEPFILLTTGQNLRTVSNNYLQRLGIRPHIAMETTNIITALAAVKAGIGLTFAQDSVFNSQETRSGLLFFTLNDPPLPLLSWEVGFSYKIGTTPKQLARLLMDEIAAYFSS